MIHDLPQQDGASIAQLRDKMPELMPGISKCKRLGSFRNALAGQHLDPVRTFEPMRVKSKMPGEFIVKADQSWRLDRGGCHRREEAGRQPTEGIIEWEVNGHAKGEVSIPIRSYQSPVAERLTQRAFGMKTPGSLAGILGELRGGFDSPLANHPPEA